MDVFSGSLQLLVPSYSEPQEFPGFLRQYQPRVTVTKLLSPTPPPHPQNPPPIFTRVLYIYFLHYSWGVDCSLAWISWGEALPYLGMMSSLLILHIRWVRREGQSEGRIGAWMDSQIAVADPGVVCWVRSNPPSYSWINKELLTLLPTYNFKRLLSVVTSIEGNIERSVTN